MGTQKAIPELAPDTRVLIERLTKLQPGEIVTYGELSAIVGWTVTGGHGRLRSARRAVEREGGVVLECVQGEGIKRLTIDEMPSIGEAAIERGRRLARRGRRRLIVGASGHELPNELKGRLIAQGAILAAQEWMGRREGVKQIEEAVKANNYDELSVQRLIDTRRSGGAEK